MDSAQTKKMLVNAGTIAIVLAVIGAGYWYFVAGRSATSEQGGTAVTVQNEAQAVEVGAEITRTLKELDDLKSAVASSVDFFSKPAFRNLEDITVPVSPESVGRDNPFALTDWKLKQKALEAAAGKAGSGSMQSTPSAPASAPGM